ncbi:hypothetical protein SLE2022_397840 [Rubroshorea leprosula]
MRVLRKIRKTNLNQTQNNPSESAKGHTKNRPSGSYQDAAAYREIYGSYQRVEESGGSYQRARKLTKMKEAIRDGSRRGRKLSESLNHQENVTGEGGSHRRFESPRGFPDLGFTGNRRG